MVCMTGSRVRALRSLGGYCCIGFIVALIVWQVRGGRKLRTGADVVYSVWQWRSGRSVRQAVCLGHDRHKAHKCGM